MDVFASPQLLSLPNNSSIFVIKRFDNLGFFLGCSLQNCGQRDSWTTMGSNVQFVEPRREKGSCIADIRYVDSTHIFILLMHLPIHAILLLDGDISSTDGI